MLAMLQAKPHRLALPGLFLYNTGSLVNTLDEIQLKFVSCWRDSCDTFVMGNSWVNDILDAVVELSGPTRLQPLANLGGGSSAIYFIKKTLCAQL